MALTNKSQILGIQWTNDSSSVKIAYNHGGTLKRVVVPETSDIVQAWRSDGGTVKDYEEPTNNFNHPTPTVTG